MRTEALFHFGRLVTLHAGGQPPAYFPLHFVAFVEVNRFLGSDAKV